MADRISNPSMPSVTLCVGSGSYMEGLAAALHQHGMLHRAIRLTPRLEIFEPTNGALVSGETFPLTDFARRAAWALWRRLPFRAYLPGPVVLTSQLTDRFVAARIGSPGILHALTGNALLSLEKARLTGITKVLEHPMVHPRDWQEQVLSECEAFGVEPRQCNAVMPERMIKRREEEFARSDFIVVPSEHAASTFRTRAVANVRVIPLGVDTRLFHPAGTPSSENKCFRVCYSGRLDLGKGVLYLLQAWKQLRLKNAELLLIGELRPEISQLVAPYVGPDITLTGFLSRQKLAARLRSSSLYMFPSLHEGMAQSALEAMASGLPVIATRSSGAADFVTHGIEGFLVEPRNVEELAERLNWFYEHRDALVGMGTNARRRIEVDFTENRYFSRMVEFYGGVNSAR